MRLSRSLLVAGLALAACQANPLPDDAELSSSSEALTRFAPPAKPKPTEPDPVDPGPGGPAPEPKVRKAIKPVQSPQLVYAPGGGYENPRTTLLAPPPGFTNREVVGVVPAGETCPADNAYWQGGDVFGSTYVPGRSGERFCSYRWIGSGAPNINRLPKYCPSGKNCEPCPTGWTCESPPTGDKWLEPSHYGVVASGLPSDARAVVSNQIKKQHAAAIGAPASFPSGSAPSGGWLPYFLPTWSRVFILDDDGLHGDTVENWIRQTACPDGRACPFITRRNVFEAGDEVGSAIKLAREIVKAANDGNGWNPIINLSLGFYWKHAWTANPNSNDDVAGANIRFAHSALQAAINYAGCKGAIVVAAAGNRDGGREAEEAGPRYFGGSAALPAAFSEIDGGWTCTSSPSKRHETLLIPVSSIRADGSVAKSAREHGKSCMRAPSMALTPEGDPLEGSSFAAATVSAILANARSYMVGATRMELIYAVLSNMQALPGPNDYRVCHAGVYQNSRVHQCRAIAAALNSTCQKAGHGIPQQWNFACGLAKQLGCANIGAVPVRLTTDVEGAATLDSCVQDSERMNSRSFVSQSAAPSVAACGVSTVQTELGDRNASSCPFRQYTNGQAEPDKMSCQPGRGGCGCTVYMAPDRSVWLVGTTLDEAMNSPTLRLSSASTEQVFELGQDVQERNGSGFSIKLTDALPEGMSIEEAEFSFSAEDGPDQAFAATLPIIEALAD